MAFGFEILGESVFGDKVVKWGSYNCNSVITGTIKTGFKKCEVLLLQPSGKTVKSDAAVIDGTFPISGGEVRIITVSGETGFWFAFGSF